MGSRARALSLFSLLLAPLLLLTACVQGATGAALPAGPLAGSSQATGISVQGEGSVAVTPDLAEVWVGVSVKAATLAEAQRDAAARMARVMEKLAALGIPRERVKTVRFTVSPEYDRNQALTGYRVDNMVSARSKALDKVGELLDGVVEAGANRVERISFTVEDPKPLAVKAREAAMADAKAKAEQLARLAGVRLGHPTYVAEGGGSLPPAPVPFARGGEAFAAVTPISPGEMEIRVNVQVVYAIE